MYIYLDKISSYPNNRELAWTDELQGLTHNEDYWFITQQKRLWRIPVGHDLNIDIAQNNLSLDIKSVPIPPELSSEYDHFGDIDCFEDFLFVAMEKTDSTITAKLACFSAATLAYIGSELIPLQTNKAPWCAVNYKDRLLYSSRDKDVSTIFAYQYGIQNNTFKISLNQIVNLKDGDGNDFVLSGIQGGVFANLGGKNSLILTSNEKPNRGINIFEMSSGKRIFYKEIDFDLWAIGEEIEGLTFWDLDNNKAPNIEGQIHVLELDNDIDSDDIKSLHHYRIIESEFVANKSHSKMEVHRFDCTWVNFIDFENRLPFDKLTEALENGFDGCFYCLNDYHKR